MHVRFTRARIYRSNLTAMWTGATRKSFVDRSNKEELRALDAEVVQLPKTPRLSSIIAPYRLDGRLQSGPLLGKYWAPPIA